VLTMTVRNLNFMFNPAAVALVGASQRPGAIGALLARNLVSAGFKGDIFPVNPKYKTIEGLETYPDVDSLPKTPDLAVIATPPDTVPGLIEALRQARYPVGGGYLGRIRRRWQRKRRTAVRPNARRGPPPFVAHRGSQLPGDNGARSGSECEFRSRTAP
jgi:hypothetical protein